MAKTMDKGHQQTDKMLNSLEKKIKREYGKAEKEVSEKLDNYLSKFAETDAKKVAELSANKITESQYLQWRADKMLNTSSFNDMRNILAQDLSNANQIAAGMINNHTIDVYALNHNYGSYEIYKGTNLDLSFSLYDHKTVENLLSKNPKIIPKARVDIPKDLRWNRAKLTSAITQGVLQGESIPKISDRLLSAVGTFYTEKDIKDRYKKTAKQIAKEIARKNRVASIRNARTYTTAAENKGRIDSYKEAEDMGIEMEQEWMATVDMRTRPSHVEMDGERVAVGETFSNGCEYPGDPAGDPEEIYNCRCTLVAVIKDYDYQSDGRFERLPEGMTYDDWKGRF